VVLLAITVRSSKFIRKNKLFIVEDLVLACLMLAYID
jgi:hypothetical protein